MTPALEKLRALLLIGQPVCASGQPSTSGLTPWVTIEPAGWSVKDHTGDASNPPLMVLSFESEATSPCPSSTDHPKSLFGKRAILLAEECTFEERLTQAIDAVRSFGVDPEQLSQASTVRGYPFWLVSTLVRTSRFLSQKTESGPCFSDAAYAQIFMGLKIGAELSPSSEALRAWVVVEPDRSFRAAGSPTFRVYYFEVSASSIEAGYDVVGEMVNEREATIGGKGLFDESAQEIQGVLSQWGIDPGKLMMIDEVKDYPM